MFYILIGLFMHRPIHVSSSSELGIFFLYYMTCIKLSKMSKIWLSRFPLQNQSNQIKLTWKMAQHFCIFYIFNSKNKMVICHANISWCCHIISSSLMLPYYCQQSPGSWRLNDTTRPCIAYLRSLIFSWHCLGVSVLHWSELKNFIDDCLMQCKCFIIVLRNAFRNRRVCKQPLCQWCL